MPVFKYSIVRNKRSKKYPRYDKNKGILYIKVNKVYKYYAEAIEINNKCYLLFGIDKFDDNCKKCNVDDYGRYKLIISSALKDVLNTIVDIEDVIKLEYVESVCNYDVFELLME